MIEDKLTPFFQKEELQRFVDAFFERYDKESDEPIKVEDSRFLGQPITYFKEHLNEFLYIESEWFDHLSVDSLCFEVDDVFRTYEVLLGLKLQKKYEKTIRAYFEQDDSAIKYSLLFNQGDGLWECNFTLNDVRGFSEDMTIHEALLLIHPFLLGLLREIEGK